MFDKTLAANGKSSQPLGVSLLIHAAAVTALFATHFTVSQIAVRRHPRVQRVAPLAPLPAKRVTVHTPSKTLPIPALVKVPAPAIPAIPAPPAIPDPPRIQAPPILAEAPPPALPAAAPPAPAVQTNVFASAAQATK